MLAKLASGQHGVVAVWQLLELGFSRREIAVRVESRRFHRAYRGVYAVGHPARTAEALEMAAVLACGPQAVLSHWTAAARWALIRPVHGRVHVIAPSDRKAQRGMRPHTACLHPHDCTKRDGIPITTVPRTLLDLSAVANERLVRRAVNQADRTGWLNRKAMAELLERNPRGKGTKQLRVVIAAVSPTTRRTRSDLELAFLALCKAYDLPEPIVNAEVEGIEVDMHWPGTTLIVELDCYEYHRTPQEFENDRRRDARLKRSGYEVLRVTDVWLESDPEDVAETVRTLLIRPG
jgi:very-short-patch-repair endonuclease